MSARAPVQRPNILFITCDTLRRDALGCTGNRIVRTPHIDRLAARGVVFRNAYTPSPLCMPARASLISGLYPHQHGIYANRCEPLSGPQRELTFASVLRRAGYDTAFVGRHHFYDFWETPGFDYRTLQDEVRRYGFDHVVQVNDKPEHAHLECDYTAYLRGKGLLEAYRAELGRGGIAPFETISEEDHHDSFAAARRSAGSTAAPPRERAAGPPDRSCSGSAWAGRTRRTGPWDRTGACTGQRRCPARCSTTTPRRQRRCSASTRSITA